MKNCLLTSSLSLVAIGLSLSALSLLKMNVATAFSIPQTAFPKTTRPVIVHFPRMPISSYNFSYTYNVNRNTANPRPETGALQSLLNGPTTAEISILNLQLIVPTTLGTCAGQPLPSGSLNAGKFMYKRQISGGNVAYKIRFCQPTSSGGIGDDARLRSAITQTLWANIGYISGGNNISQIDISYSNGLCITNGGNSPCWP